MAVFTYASPCIPIIPRQSGWLRGKPPRPRSVSATGVPVFSAKAWRTCVAPDSMTPWPARMSGPLGSGDQLGGLPQVAPLELGERAAAGRLHGLGPAELRRRLLHVLADVDEDRAGAARAGDLERLDEGGGEVLDLRHEDVVLRDRHRDADDVRFLEGVRAEDLRGDLAGDEDDRDRVEHRRGDAGDEVRGAGTRGAEGDADAAAGAGVAVGRVRGSLLVADEDVVDRVVHHRVVDRQDRPAGVSEHGVDAFADEAFPDDLRSGLLHEVLPAVRPMGWVVSRVRRLARGEELVAVAQDGAARGVGDEGAVAAQPGARDRAAGRQRSFAAALHLLGADLEVERPRVEVEGDEVALPHVADRPALGRLGADVADAGAARPAGEAAVGDEGDRLAEAHPHDGGGGGEHLLHSRAAARAFVAQDDDVPLLHEARGDPLHRGFLALEDDGRAAVPPHRRGDARRLHDGALRGERPEEDGEAAAGRVGVRRPGGSRRRPTRAPSPRGRGTCRPRSAGRGGGGRDAERRSRIAGTPPAAWTSSMCHGPLGATFVRWGVRSATSLIRSIG